MYYCFRRIMLTGVLSEYWLLEQNLIALCQQGVTGRLLVQSDPYPSVFYLEHGNIVHCRLGTLAGEAAVFAALGSANTLNVNFEFTHAIPSPEISIYKRYDALLVEASVAKDENRVPPILLVNDLDLTYVLDIGSAQLGMPVGNKLGLVTEQNYSEAKSNEELVIDKPKQVPLTASILGIEKRYFRAAILGLIILSTAVVTYTGVFAGKRASKEVVESSVTHVVKPDWGSQSSLTSQAFDGVVETNLISPTPQPTQVVENREKVKVSAVRGREEVERRDLEKRIREKAVEDKRKEPIIQQVKLKLIINETGLVSSAVVLSGAKDEATRQAALRAIRGRIYKNLQAGSITITIPVRSTSAY
jgi:hypothetical protein